MAAWSLCTMVLANAYTGNMLSHLLAQKQGPTINSLKELVASSLLWVVRRGSSTETLFMVVISINITFSYTRVILHFLFCCPRMCAKMNLLTGRSKKFSNRIPNCSSARHQIAEIKSAISLSAENMLTSAYVPPPN